MVFGFTYFQTGCLGVILGMQPISKDNPYRPSASIKQSMSATYSQLQFSSGKIKRAAESLLPVAVILSSLFPQTLMAPAFAADEILLKPDVPKLDTPLEAPTKTLKGNIQHSHKKQDPNRKPFSAGVNQSGPSLGNPGTARVAPRRAPMKAQNRNNMLDASAFAGIGIIGVKFEMMIGRPPTIKIVFAGTPASDEGIRPNDVIVAVDGIPTYGLTKEEVYDLIVGTPHTSVTLSLQRGGDFSVKRLTRMDFNEIPDPQVKADYLRSM